MHFRSEISVFMFHRRNLDAPQWSERDLDLQPSAATLPQSLVGEIFRNQELHQLFHKVLCPNPVPAWSLFVNPRCRMRVTVYTCIPNMHPILIAHRMPSKHSEATC